MKNIRAVVFDMDGTLLDTLSSLWYSAGDSLRREGLRELPRDNFRYYAGDGARTLVERYLKDTDTDPLSGIEARDPHDTKNLDYFVSSYLSSFDLYSDFEVIPYEGIPELIAALKARGIKMGVCTNKPHPQAERGIRTHFGSEIDIVIGQKEGIPKKPDPTGALMIAAALGVSPDEALYIGDTAVDIATGRGAGMITVGALWGFREREELLDAGAELLAESPLDVLKFLD